MSKKINPPELDPHKIADIGDFWLEFKSELAKAGLSEDHANGDKRGHGKYSEPMDISKMSVKKFADLLARMGFRIKFVKGDG